MTSSKNRSLVWGIKNKIITTNKRRVGNKWFGFTYSEVIKRETVGTDIVINSEEKIDKVFVNGEEFISKLEAVDKSVDDN